jgi:hypothetical protein
MLAPSSEGADVCPCLTNLTVAPWALSVAESTFFAAFGNVSLSTYGRGCAAHDQIRCTTSMQPAGCDPTIIPVPAGCSSVVSNWCQHSWCYVDPNECAVSATHSNVLPGRTYSFATCGDLDDRQDMSAVETSLRGRVLRVMYRRNSAGWIGSYHPLPHSDHRDDRWTGPCVLPR